MKYLLLAIAAVISASFVTFHNEVKPKAEYVNIGQGQMPNVTTDSKGNIHLVFGSGDSILYSSSNDQGKSFSNPRLVSVLPNLAASAMRGPQIAASSNGVIVIACNKDGDIFSYRKANTQDWQLSGKVNDVDTVAKEGLMALSADGQRAYAVWLDLRDKHNKIFGARSTDGGKSWSKNVMIYTSPDETVCECCKPSVELKGKNVFVMFRNWLNGNRDLYLITSADEGATFGKEQKLGYGSWPLKGCPMDGGGLAIHKNGNIQTVWRRETTIYTTAPGKEEIQLGEGRNCTIESVNGKNVYDWTLNGEVIIMKPDGAKVSLGKGSLPVLSTADNDQVICVWTKEKQIQAAVVRL